MNVLKLITTYLFLSLHGLQCFSQLSEEDSIRIDQELEKAIKMLQTDLRNKANDLIVFDEDQIAFTIDTFRIEHRETLVLDVQYSTRAIVEAIFNSSQAYDRLLNTYYRNLMTKLEPEDQQILKISQRNWITFRDSEFSLNGVLMQDQYSGGGTIQRIEVASRNKQLVKTRVIELSQYLSRIIE